MKRSVHTCRGGGMQTPNRLSILTPLQSLTGWKGTGRQDGSRSHEKPCSSKSTFALIVLLPASLTLPSHLHLTLSICLSLSLHPRARSILYSVDTHIIQVYRGFLPAPRPANKANLCSLRGGGAWRVRGRKMDALNAALYCLLAETVVQVITTYFLLCASHDYI